MATRVAHAPRVDVSIAVIWRSLVLGVAYVVFSMATGMVDQLLRLPVPDVANNIDVTQFAVGTALAGVVMGFTLGPLTSRLALPARDRALVLFILIYGISTLSIGIEGLFFTTIITPDVFYRPSGLLANLLLAATIAWLFRPAGPVFSLRTLLGETLVRRGWLDWTWRVLLAGVLYVPTYLFFGVLVSPIVVPYYTDPSLGLGLQIPGYEVMLPLEVLRGVLFVIIVFPLLVSLRSSRWAQAFWIGLALAVLGSWVPMLRGIQMPAALRITHGLEITADSFVQGLTIAWLLGMRREKAS